MKALHVRESELRSRHKALHLPSTPLPSLTRPPALIKMHATLARLTGTSKASTSSLLSHLASLPPTVAAAQATSRTLPVLLSSLPSNGEGLRVRQRKWAAKGLDVPRGTPLAGPMKKEEQQAIQQHGCFWEVTRVKMKDDGKHAKAWGRLTWRGESMGSVLRV